MLGGAAGVSLIFGLSVSGPLSSAPAAVCAGQTMKILLRKEANRAALGEEGVQAIVRVLCSPVSVRCAPPLECAYALPPFLTGCPAALRRRLRMPR